MKLYQYETSNFTRKYYCSIHVLLAQYHQSKIFVIDIVLVIQRSALILSYKIFLAFLISWYM